MLHFKPSYVLSSIGFLCTALFLNYGKSFAQNAPAADVTLDLISPLTCNVDGTLLKQCAIQEQTILARSTSTAVPVRTVLKIKKTGKCATRFPRELSVTLPGEPEAKFLYLQENETVLRLRTSAAIQSVSIKDTSPMANISTFDTSCKIELSIIFNEPDVYTKTEAEGMLELLHLKLEKKKNEKELYHQLVLTQQGFSFMHTLAEKLYLELTNETMQSLRANIGVLDQIVFSCSSSLSVEERKKLINLYFALGALGSPGDWQSPDGTPMTLKEYLDQREPNLHQIVENIAKMASAEAVLQAQQAFRQASQEAVELEAQYALAKAQLRVWLNL